MTNVYKNVAHFLNAFLQSKSKNKTKINVINFELFHNTTHSISLFIFRLAKNRNGPGRAGLGRAHNGPGRAQKNSWKNGPGRAGPEVGRAGPGRAYKIRPVQTSTGVPRGGSDGGDSPRAAPWPPRGGNFGA